MSELHVNILYGPPNNNGYKHMVTFKKTFKLNNVPNVPCRIKIDSNIFEFITFNFPKFYPEKICM